MHHLSRLLALPAISLLLLNSCTVPVAPSPEKPVPAADALARLKDGNARFASQRSNSARDLAGMRKRDAQSQHPFAIVVGCADSRTSPELVFDQGLGDLFVVRTAGNLVDDHALGSIEYGVEHLGARLIVVLGHERCGAVKATLGGGHAPGHIGSLVNDIAPAVAASKGRPGDPLDNAVKENAARVGRAIKSNAHLGELKKDVTVISGVYDLDTGIVAWQQ